MFERMDFGMAGMDALLWWPVLGLLWPDYWEVREVRGDHRVMQWCKLIAFLRPFGSKSRFADSENKLRSSLIQCMSSWAAEDVESGNSYRRFANSNWIIFTYCILLLLCNFSRIIAIHRPIGLVDAQQKTRGKADDKHVLKAVAAYPVQGASSKLQRIINDPKASIPTYRTMPVFFFFFSEEILTSKLDSLCPIFSDDQHL